MSEYRVHRPRAGKGFAVVIGVLIVLSLAAVFGQKRWVDVAASVPAFSLAVYVMVALWRNDVEVTAGPAGIRVWYGPLVLWERERLIGRGEIAEVCVRDFSIIAKTGKRWFRTAGVVFRDGDSLDIYVSSPPHPETEGEARKIAAALGWVGAIAHYDLPGKRRWRRANVVTILRTVGAVAACAGWAYLMER